MKKIFKVIGIVLGVVMLFVAIGATYIHISGIPTYDKPQIPTVTVESTPEKIEKGEKIASMLCVHCHSDNNNLLVGKKVEDIPTSFGSIFSANITNHKEKGIGNWSDGEIIYFLRTGLRKDGSYSPPYMPKFPLLSDADIESLVAWLRSDRYAVQASNKVPPKTEPSFLVKFLCRVAFKPLPYPEKKIENPDTTDVLAWGKYLANGQYACFSCHSADFKTNNELEPEKSVGFYGGGNLLLDLQGNIIKSANITPHQTGIANWTEEDFIVAMRTGKRKNGEQFKYPMLPYTRLTDGELKAIYAYLNSVPAIDHKVE